MPIEITDWNELDAVRQDLDEEYVLLNDIDETSAGYDDHVGENAPNGWDPIGNDAEPFTGSLIGVGNEISDLIIDRSDEDHIGLFGDVDDGASISCLTIKDCDINGKHHVGGISGSNSGIILDCSVEGTLTGDVMDEDDFTQIGGITGLCTADGRIDNSYADVTITANGLNAAGIVGECPGEVIDCYSSGSVMTTTNQAGGIAGVMNGTVENCYSTCTVEASTLAGGLIVGSTVEADVINCFSTGTVTVDEGGMSGGLIGWDGTESDVTASYWNTETSGLNESYGGEGRTTEQMTWRYAKDVTYVGWDLHNLVYANWYSGDHELVEDHEGNSGYPALAQQGPFNAFKYTGTRRFYDLSDVFVIHVIARGAGGAGGYTSTGGNGSYISAEFNVTDIDELVIYVGGAGEYGGSGGWGLHEGGDAAGDFTGAGGGSTEILTDPDTENQDWLLGVDSGGGGADSDDDWETGGSGGGRCGVGGNGDEDGEPQDAECDGEGYGGDGGDGFPAEDGDENGRDAGVGDECYNNDYLIDVLEEHAGSGGSGGDVQEDGEHGEIVVAELDPIEVSTIEVDETTEDSVIIKGSLDRLLVYDSVDGYFEYKKEEDEEWQQTPYIELTEEGEFTYQIENLQETTIYDYRAVVKNDDQLYYGDTLKFMTAHWSIIKPDALSDRQWLSEYSELHGLEEFYDETDDQYYLRLRLGLVDLIENGDFIDDADGWEIERQQTGGDTSWTGVESYDIGGSIRSTVEDGNTEEAYITQEFDSFHADNVDGDLEFTAAYMIDYVNRNAIQDDITFEIREDGNWVELFSHDGEVDWTEQTVDYTPTGEIDAIRAHVLIEADTHTTQATEINAFVDHISLEVNFSYDEGYRISPSYTTEIKSTDENETWWLSDEPENTDISIFYAVTDTDTAPNRDDEVWEEMTSGEEFMPHEEDLRNRYIWFKQELYGDGESTPTLYRQYSYINERFGEMFEEIVNSFSNNIFSDSKRSKIVKRTIDSSTSNLFGSAARVKAVLKYSISYLSGFVTKSEKSENTTKLSKSISDVIYSATDRIKSATRNTISFCDKIFTSSSKFEKVSKVSRSFVSSIPSKIQRAKDVLRKCVSFTDNFKSATRRIKKCVRYSNSFLNIVLSKCKRSKFVKKTIQSSLLSSVASSVRIKAVLKYAISFMKNVSTNTQRSNIIKRNVYTYTDLIYTFTKRAKDVLRVIVSSMISSFGSSTRVKQVIRRCLSNIKKIQSYSNKSESALRTSLSYVFDLGSIVNRYKKTSRDAVSYFNFIYTDSNRYKSVIRGVTSILTVFDSFTNKIEHTNKLSSSIIDNCLSYTSRMKKCVRVSKSLFKNIISECFRSKVVKRIKHSSTIPLLTSKVRAKAVLRYAISVFSKTYSETSRAYTPIRRTIHSLSKIMITVSKTKIKRFVRSFCEFVLSDVLIRVLVRIKSFVDNFSTIKYRYKSIVRKNVGYLNDIVVSTHRYKIVIRHVFSSIIDVYSTTLRIKKILRSIGSYMNIYKTTVKRLKKVIRCVVSEFSSSVSNTHRIIIKFVTSYSNMNVISSIVWKVVNFKPPIDINILSEEFVRIKTEIFGDKK